MKGRNRNQMVIALGEGAEGAVIKRQLQEAAQRQGLTLSAWSRSVLIEAGGLRDDRFVQRTELEALERRLRAVEADLVRVLGTSRR